MFAPVDWRQARQTAKVCLMVIGGFALLGAIGSLSVGNTGPDGYLGLVIVILATAAVSALAVIVAGIGDVLNTRARDRYRREQLLRERDERDRAAAQRDQQAKQRTRSARHQARQAAQDDRTVLICETCGKPLTGAIGLRQHMKAKHPPS